MTTLMVRVLILSAAVIFSPAFAEENTGVLTLDITGANPNKGQIIISVYDTEESFLKAALRTVTLPVDDKGGAEFKIADLAFATYSVSAIYDEDSNNELNTNFIGIPKELIGFSNNARGRFGPPSYQETSFPFDQAKTVPIALSKIK
ncbi:hypothetical protein SIN8267_01241 [Sinobacterium norvegicum]|uniref:DUF2141 domain-containing protein n=1 Tax=Sinobacterium norvegicum TaxID=1641715 RepID=A0ABM9AD64_9GAMM|nr:DUF2141 domain-containing protein [Sinobacterium norvegicum]CAH0991139.1 hypothetical protein SIN8267_01241 [Sinobacterium norvegicum]